MTVRAVVAGGREFDDKALLYATLDTLFVKQGDMVPRSMEVMCGMARGADSLGEQWAVTNWAKLVEFPADWDTYGKAAGYRRNVEMAEYAAQVPGEGWLVAFWDGVSTGTKHMIDLAFTYNLNVVVIHYDG